MTVNFRHFPRFMLLISALALMSGPSHAHAAVDAQGDGFPTLKEIHSVNGVLTATLDAAPKKVNLGKVSINATVFNGSYAGPVLRVHPGDMLKIKLLNHTDDPLNLHFHGIHTSPLGKSDNMMLEAAPGESLAYEVKIPRNQPPGLYWYHTHIHGLSEKHTKAGLSGALVVEGLQSEFPQLAHVQEKLFVLKDYTFDKSDDPVVKDYFHKFVQTIDGRTAVTATMRPGETQLWRFGNQSADLYFHLALKGHKFRIIATDGVATNQETVVDKIDIGPAQRIEALVDAGEAGDYDLVSLNTVTGSGADKTADRVLGHLHVAGGAEQAVAPLAAFPAHEDLRQHKIDAERTITFTQKISDDGSNDQYFIDGHIFDHHRIDIRVPFGNVEEWTVKNDSEDVHLFHIHQIHFQLVEENGVPQPFEGYLDTVKVPEHGEVKLILPFNEPQIIGTFVYHCHILEHEDKGMMAFIQVYDPAKENQPTP